MSWTDTIYATVLLLFVFCWRNLNQTEKFHFAKKGLCHMQPLKRIEVAIRKVRYKAREKDLWEQTVCGSSKYSCFVSEFLLLLL